VVKRNLNHALAVSLSTASAALARRQEEPAMRMPRAADGVL
jgi:hypothetical protein